MTKNVLNDNLSTDSVKTQSLPYWFKVLLCKAVGYFNGELYRFVLSSSNELSLTLEHKNIKPLITIFSRSYYNESAKSYPVESKSELKKLLSLEYGSSENIFYHAWGNNKDQNQVNIWEFFSKYPDSLIKIPESLVLAQTLEENEVLLNEPLNNNDSFLFVARSHSLIHSLLKTPIINSVSRFCMAAGLPMLEDELILAKNEQPQRLAKGLIKLKPSILFSFIRNMDSKNNLSLLKQITIPIVAASTVYLLSTSAFLLYKQGALEDQLNEKSEQVSSALQQQQAFDNNLARYQALKQFVSSQSVRSGVWLLMADVFSKASITNVRIVANRYVIRGTIGKATDLLEQISNHPNVKSAKFDFPTRKGRALEVFVISFELSEQLFMSNSNAEQEPLVSTQEETHGGT